MRWTACKRKEIFFPFFLTDVVGNQVLIAMIIVAEHGRVARWVNCLITVRSPELKTEEYMLIAMRICPGVDACNTVLGVFIFAGTMNLGQSWATVMTLWGAVMTFYVQTWDEYFTHVLTLGIVSGPVEGILTLCAVFTFTAYIGGGSFWHRPMLATLGVAQPSFLPETLYKLPFTSWYMIYGAGVLFFATGSSIINVMRARRARLENPITPLFGLLPFAYMWTLTPLYLYLQPGIRETHLLAFLTYVGIVNAYSVGQMIVAHLLKTPFPNGNVLIWPLAVAVLDSAGPHLGLWPSALGKDIYQVAFVFTALGISVGVYASFVVSLFFSELFERKKEKKKGAPD